ncbi:MAG: efflux RND transporter permease subunit [Candidatus Eremiobacteraeota bacterium]|nr:efflux RND transporter permease subunit [Candidatus Eremiobacteraeota bacterium]
MSTATGGTISSYFQVNGTQFPIILESPASQRRTYASLNEFAVSLPPLSGVPAAGANGFVPISTTGGTGAPSGLLGSVPLTAVANIKFGMGPSQISRQNKERRIDINAPIVGRTLGEVVGQSKVIMDQLPLPQGYHWQFGPAIQQNSDTFSALGLIVFLAIALIYMLLAAQFESYLHPLIIIVAIPLAGAGIVLSLLVTNRAFGLTAFIGTLMFVGIVVKNAILVVEFTNQLRRAGRTARAALLQAAPMRLRPILMTTLATIGGMLPISLGIEPGSSTQAPLGTVVIGGLITSTLLSLVVIPTLYLWASRRIERRDPDEFKTQIPDAEVQPIRAVVEEYVG